MPYQFIMAVDPGVTTGLCYGVVDRIPGASASDLISEYGLDLTVEEVYEKDEVKSGIEIAQLFITKRAEMLKTTRPRCNRCTLVIEDFQLRPSGLPSRARSVLAPVRVTAAIEAMLLIKKIPHNDDFTKFYKRQPGNSKAYATDARIREWGIWEVTKGKSHGRDALRHWCAQLASTIGTVEDPNVHASLRVRTPKGKPTARRS